MLAQNSTTALSLDEELQDEYKSDIEHSPVREKQSDLEQSPATENHVEPTQTSQSPVNPYHPSQFPDGGKNAYLCLLGGFCCLFCSFGWLNCLGVFQNYYQMNQLRDYSSSTIAWIPSIQIFVMFFPGPIVGWVFDNYGPKYILIFGTFFHVFGLMMTSLCTEYYQLILAQAVCSHWDSTASSKQVQARFLSGFSRNGDWHLASWLRVVD
jgi:hypothetical protein